MLIMLLYIVGDGTLEAQAIQNSNGLHWGLLDFVAQLWNAKEIGVDVSMW